MKLFTLLKDLTNNKNEHVSDKFTPLVPNDIFALSGSEDSTENEDEDDSPNIALLKLIKSIEEYLTHSFPAHPFSNPWKHHRVVDGTSKDVFFSEKIRGIKSTPVKVFPSN